MSNDDDRWSWVPVLMSEARKAEQRFAKAASSSARFTYSAAVDARDGAIEGAQQTLATAEAHARMSAQHAGDVVAAAVQSYPEAAVGTGMVASAATLGWAPKRITICTLLVAYGLQETLTAKYGSSLVAASSALSTFMREGVEAAIGKSLLPPPRSSS